VRSFVFAMLVGLAACAGETSRAPEGPVDIAFDASARAAGVPRDLLVAIAVVEEGLEVSPRPDLPAETEIPAAGPLQLRRGKLDTLRRASELAQVEELTLRRDPDRALAAGALVLSELGAKTRVTSDLASWAAALEEMSGFVDAPHREDYAHRVFAVLARGGSFRARDGEVLHMAPHDLPPTLTLDVSEQIKTLAPAAQFEGAEWIPTSCTRKCDPTRDATVGFVLIHDTEGSWSASVATLQNDPGKSAHYIIGQDGRIGQFVTEETTAWHAGNIFYNERSIGIEHVGWATKPFPEAQYAASARLVGHLTGKYGITRDREHVIGHDQVPNGKRIAIDSKPCAESPSACQESTNYGGANNHSDPGIWEWAPYMLRFDGRAKCNDVTNVFACNYDKTVRMGCTGTNVVVEACADASCRSESGPNQKDAVCIRPAVTAKPPVNRPPDGGAPLLEATNDIEYEEGGGCAVGGARHEHAAIAMAAALVGLVTRRRRRP
jgi:MYXO-CTERM domain-containing protein